MVKAIKVFVNNLSWSIEQVQNTILFPQNFRLEAGKILGVVGAQWVREINTFKIII